VFHPSTKLTWHSWKHEHEISIVISLSKLWKGVVAILALCTRIVGFSGTVTSACETKEGSQ
jgi:hypothetical protein